MKKIRVLHFVTGGFSGATSVAVDIITGHQAYSDIESLLVLRQKKTTTSEKLASLEKKGINYQLVINSPHFATSKQLQQIIKEWQPDILVAHGFPEHIIGRTAGKKANVPHMVQVEHNSKERYTFIKLWQTRHLSQFTDSVVAVSKGVAQVLNKQQLKAPIIAIHNGIDPARFDNQPLPIQSRPDDIIMVARFAKSKDHATLIEALNLLKQKNITPTLTLVGSGKTSYQNLANNLVKKYGLSQQVTLINHSNEIPQLLAKHKIFVMSSRFEGLNLSVIEAMAAGCLVIGSDAVGVNELIEHKKDGLVFSIGDAQTLANQLESVLTNPLNFETMTIQARQKVLSYYTKSRMLKDYYDVFTEIMNR